MIEFLAIIHVHLDHHYYEWKYFKLQCHVIKNNARKTMTNTYILSDNSPVPINPEVDKLMHTPIIYFLRIKKVIKNHVILVSLLGIYQHPLQNFSLVCIMNRTILAVNVWSWNFFYVAFLTNILVVFSLFWIIYFTLYFFIFYLLHNFKYKITRW